MATERKDDVRAALTLAATFAAFATAAVPLLLPSLPPQARSLPLPLPAFCALMAVQLTLVYGALAYAGIRLARRRGLDPVADLAALRDRRAARPSWRALGRAGGIGLACGAGLIAAVAAIRATAKDTLPRVLHPPGLPAALAASAAGALGEEILFRLFVLSLVLRVMPPGRRGRLVAVGTSALAFAAAHAPASVFLFGGLQRVPPVAWLWSWG
jgi:membrane protease YdiL (CAAX protease family)